MKCRTYNIIIKWMVISDRITKQRCFQVSSLKKFSDLTSLICKIIPKTLNSLSVVSLATAFLILYSKRWLCVSISEGWFTYACFAWLFQTQSQISHDMGEWKCYFRWCKSKKILATIFTTKFWKNLNLGSRTYFINCFYIYCIFK